MEIRKLVCFKYSNIEDIYLASEDSRARSVSGSVDPALISTDVVGSNPSECMLELASGITQIKYAVSINRDIGTADLKIFKDSERSCSLQIESPH